MRKYQILAALVFALTLGIMAPVTVIATDGDDDGTTTQTTVVEVTSQTQLISAGQNKGTEAIKLMNNIEVTQLINIGHNLDIDLNGYSITSSVANSAVLKVTAGNVNITGQGSIITTGDDSDVIHVTGNRMGNVSNNEYAVLTIGKDVILDATGSTTGFSYGILVDTPFHASTPSDGITINLYGTIKADSGIYINGIVPKTDYSPIINIEDGAVIDTTNTAIYGAGYGTWNIGAADITAGAAGIAAKSGVYNLTNTTIVANGADSTPAASDGQIEESGAVFQIEQNDNYPGGIVFNINGGNFTSTNSSVFLDYTDDTTAALDKLEGINIEDGSFTAAAGKPVINFITPASTHPVDDLALVKVNDGQFTSDVSSYLPEDKKLSSRVENGETIYYVAGGSYDPEVVPEPEQPVEDETESDVEAPNSGTAGRHAARAYFTNASAIWAGVIVLTAVGAIIVTARRSGHSE